MPLNTGLTATLGIITPHTILLDAVVGEPTFTNCTKPARQVIPDKLFWPLNSVRIVSEDTEK